MKGNVNRMCKQVVGLHGFAKTCIWDMCAEESLKVLHCSMLGSVRLHLSLFVCMCVCVSSDKASLQQ